jgi:hypothetical protein
MRHRLAVIFPQRVPAMIFTVQIKKLKVEAVRNKRILRQTSFY